MSDVFDLENFPTSAIGKQMLSRVSPIYNNSYVGKWLYQVMGLELDEARALVESLRDQCYLERATWGMSYWEERYGLTVDETADLEERRSRVMLKRRKAGAMSPAALEEILEALTGREISVEENNNHYRFSVSIDEGNSKIDYVAFIKKINTVKPSHLAYSIELPRKGSMTLYFAAALFEVKDIAFTEYDHRGVVDVTWLVDENGNVLADGSGNVFVDN